MTEHDYRGRGDRRHLSLTDAAVLFTLLLQVAAIVWGAATLTATVRQVTSEVRDARAEVRSLSDRTGQLSIDQHLIPQDQLDNPSIYEFVFQPKVGHDITAFRPGAHTATFEAWPSNKTYDLSTLLPLGFKFPLSACSRLSPPCPPRDFTSGSAASC